MTALQQNNESAGLAQQAGVCAPLPDTEIQLALPPLRYTDVTTNSEIETFSHDPSSPMVQWKPKGCESFADFFVRSISELRFFKFAMLSFVVNNLRRRYQRSALGFAWSLLNPILNMCVLTMVFSLIFKADPMKFSIYVFTGLTPWAFIQDSLNAACSTYVGAEPFLKKAYIPKLFFPITSVATEGANFVFSLTALFCIGLFLGIKLQWALLSLPAVIAITGIFVFGLSIVTAVATVYFRDLTHLIRVFLLSIFYLIPICYPLQQIPEHVRHYFYYNPFFHFVSAYRAIIFESRFLTASEWVTITGLAVASFLLGMIILHKREKELIFRL
jgi:ABC-type polysaccharide/polyol phosphate export permease